MPTFKSNSSRRKGRDAANEPVATPQRRQPKKSKIKRFLLFLLLILLVMLMSVGATLYFTWPASASFLGLEAFVKTENSEQLDAVAPAPIAHTPEVASKPIPAPSEKPLFASLEPFTVTIYNGNRYRAFHVAMTMQVRDEASLDVLTQYSPVVRDRVLRVLSEQHPIHVQTQEGRKQLVDHLIHALSSPYGGPYTAPRIQNVLFTAFVIQ